LVDSVFIDSVLVATNPTILCFVTCQAAAKALHYRKADLAPQFSFCFLQF